MLPSSFRVAVLISRRSLRQNPFPQLSLRACSNASKARPSAAASESAAPSEQPAAGSTGPAEQRDAAAPSGVNASGPSSDGRGLVLQAEEESLPPLAFEPGIAGAAQKGVSAVVIAFGAAALGACLWGASQALFPSATR